MISLYPNLDDPFYWWLHGNYCWNC